MAPKTRIKSAAAAVDVPQNRESAAAAIAAIGIASRELERVQADMNDVLAAVKEEHEKVAEPLRRKIEALTHGLQIYADANRAILTNNYKVKTVALTTGELIWRMNPPSVRLCDTEENVIAACEAAGHREFVRYTPALNRDAIKADPDSAAGIAGLRIGQSEAFVVVPFAAELAEVAA
ncbi:MAG: host-nuclease inhibitor Gam family protein [Dechloromonas sp.]|mgnify:CR=1 FL=1|jgi:phage host-nuclease inhibitor protein Gam|nr:host-nuclease inhibitor Gam family protein [Dechloromonas sp.]